MINSIRHPRQQQRLEDVAAATLMVRERERENYAEKGGNPFLHTLREWAFTYV